MTPLRRLRPCYFVVQATAIAAWWTWLACSPSMRAAFAWRGWPDELLWCFALPDLVVLLPASLLAARGNRAARWLTLGALCYATLWCLIASARTDSAWLGTALMSAATLATAALACCGDGDDA